MPYIDRLNLLLDDFLEVFLLLFHQVVRRWRLLLPVLILVNVIYSNFVVKLFDEVAFQRRPLLHWSHVDSLNVELSAIIIKDIHLRRHDLDPWGLWRWNTFSLIFFQNSLLLFLSFSKVFRLGKHRFEMLLLLGVHVLDETGVHILSNQIHRIFLLLQRTEVLEDLFPSPLQNADVILGDGALLRQSLALM